MVSGTASSDHSRDQEDFDRDNCKSSEMASLDCKETSCLIVKSEPFNVDHDRSPLSTTAASSDPEDVWKIKLSSSELISKGDEQLQTPTAMGDGSSSLQVGCIVGDSQGTHNPSDSGDHESYPYIPKGIISKLLPLDTNPMLTGGAVFHSNCTVAAECIQELAPTENDTKEITGLAVHRTDDSGEMRSEGATLITNQTVAKEFTPSLTPASENGSEICSLSPVAMESTPSLTPGSENGSDTSSSSPATDASSPSCSICGKIFYSMRYTSHYIEGHMRMHTGEKPFHCHVCGRGFSLNQNMTKHMRIHTGEKRFSCPHCGKLFGDSQSMKRHTRIHTGERPYKCAVCQERFRYREMYIDHMKDHSFHVKQRRRGRPCTADSSSMQLESVAGDISTGNPEADTNKGVKASSDAKSVIVNDSENLVEECQSHNEDKMNQGKQIVNNSEASNINERCLDHSKEMLQQGNFIVNDSDIGKIDEKCSPSKDTKKQDKSILNDSDIRSDRCPSPNKDAKNMIANDSEISKTGVRCQSHSKDASKQDNLILNDSEITKTNERCQSLNSKSKKQDKLIVNEPEISKTGESCHKDTKMRRKRKRKHATDDSKKKPNMSNNVHHHLSYLNYQNYIEQSKFQYWAQWQQQLLYHNHVAAFSPPALNLAISKSQAAQGFHHYNYIKTNAAVDLSMHLLPSTKQIAQTPAVNGHHHRGDIKADSAVDLSTHVLPPTRQIAKTESVNGHLLKGDSKTDSAVDLSTHCLPSTIKQIPKTQGANGHCLKGEKVSGIAVDPSTQSLSSNTQIVGMLSKNSTVAFNHRATSLSNSDRNTFSGKDVALDFAVPFVSSTYKNAGDIRANAALDLTLPSESHPKCEITSLRSGQAPAHFPAKGIMFPHMNNRTLDLGHSHPVLPYTHNSGSFKRAATHVLGIQTTSQGNEILGNGIKQTVNDNSIPRRSDLLLNTDSIDVNHSMSKFICLEKGIKRIHADVLSTVPNGLVSPKFHSDNEKTTLNPVPQNLVHSVEGVSVAHSSDVNVRPPDRLVQNNDTSKITEDTVVYNTLAEGAVSEDCASTKGIIAHDTQYLSYTEDDKDSLKETTPRDKSDSFDTQNSNVSDGVVSVDTQNSKGHVAGGIVTFEDQNSKGPVSNGIISCDTQNSKGLVSDVIGFYDTQNLKGSVNNCMVSVATQNFKGSVSDGIQNSKGSSLHQTQETVVCEICGKTIKRRGYLQTHMRTHTGERPHKCIVCGQGFAVSQNMYKHMRVHTREKRYSCVHCGREFRDSQSRNRHVRLHTGEKAYKCEVCGEMFMYKHKLDIHRKNHDESISESNLKFTNINDLQKSGCNTQGREKENTISLVHDIKVKDALLSMVSNGLVSQEFLSELEKSTSNSVPQDLVAEVEDLSGTEKLVSSQIIQKHIGNMYTWKSSLTEAPKTFSNISATHESMDETHQLSDDATTHLKSGGIEVLNKSRFLSVHPKSISREHSGQSVTQQIFSNQVRKRFRNQSHPQKCYSDTAVHVTCPEMPVKSIDQKVPQKSIYNQSLWLTEESAFPIQNGIMKETHCDVLEEDFDSEELSDEQFKSSGGCLLVPGNHICRECGEMFDYKTELDAHVVMHKEESLLSSV